MIDQSPEYYRILSYGTGALGAIIFFIVYKWQRSSQYGSTIKLISLLEVLVILTGVGLLIATLSFYIKSNQLDFKPKFAEYLKTAHIYSSCGTYVGVLGYQARSAGQPTFSLDDGSFIMGAAWADYNFVLNPLKKNDRICAKYIIMPSFAPSRLAGEKTIIKLTKEVKGE